MIKTYRDFVEEFRLIYHKEIEPLISEGENETARSLLYNIVFVIEKDNKIFNFDQIVSVHNGLSLLASIKGLYNNLERKNFDKERDTLKLRAYLAQTTLPTQEEVNAMQ